LPLFFTLHKLRIFTARGLSLLNFLLCRSSVSPKQYHRIHECARSLISVSDDDFCRRLRYAFTASAFATPSLRRLLPSPSLRLHCDDFRRRLRYAFTASAFATPSLRLLADVHDGFGGDESVFAVPAADDPLVVDDGRQLDQDVARSEGEFALAQRRVVLQRHHATFDSGGNVFSVGTIFGRALKDGDVLAGRGRRRQILALRNHGGGGGAGGRERRRKGRGNVGGGGGGERRMVVVVAGKGFPTAGDDGRLALAFRHLARLLGQFVAGSELVDAESRRAENFAGIPVGAAAVVGAVLQENVFAGNVAGRGGARSAAGDGRLEERRGARRRGGAAGMMRRRWGRKGSGGGEGGFPRRRGVERRSLAAD